VLELLVKTVVNATMEIVSAHLRIRAVLSVKPDGVHATLQVCTARHGVHAMNKRLAAIAILDLDTPATSVNILLDAIFDARTMAPYGLILPLLQELAVIVVIVSAYGQVVTALSAV
jgi:hypothetical protein